MSNHCSDCGHTFNSSTSPEAQARIDDLETQVRQLNSKASSYIDRLADYEDEIRVLQQQCAKLQKEKEDGVPTKDVPVVRLAEKEALAVKTVNRQSLSRLSTFTSYLPGRRKDSSDVPPVPPLSASLNQSSPNLSTPTAEYMGALSPPSLAIDPGRPGPSLTLVGLQSSLETERNLRHQAESSLAQSQTELEELTAQLFGQANEMVATERKARAKLEERVKLLETRDGDKRRRLDRLEKAVERIERIRRMVVDHEKEMGDEAYTQTDLLGGRKIMRHMQHSRSHSRRRDGYNRTRGLSSVPDLVSEDEEDGVEGVLDDNDTDNSIVSYEFDVQLKVWRRSKANLWRAPNYD